MFANLLAPLRAKVNLALTSAICYAVAGVAAMTIPQRKAAVA
jgi:hypothetical protein